MAGASTTNTDITIDQLAPNNYLTIVWRDNKGEIANTIDIKNGCYARVTRELNNAINQGISNNKVQYAGQNKFCNVETIGKYVANNALSNSTQRRVASGLITMASGDHTKLPNMVSNATLNVFGDVANKTASSLGLSDPTGVFSQVAGEAVIGNLTNLAQKALDKLTKKAKQLNEPKQPDFTTTIDKTQYVGLLIGITTSDTESMEVTIPRKKVESGSNYTTHLLPQPWKKEFNVTLTNKIINLDSTGNPIVEQKANRSNIIGNIEATKNKLIEIANSRVPFDIYIRLSETHMYKRSNVVFSSITFTKDENSGDTYACSFTLEPIQEFKSKIFVSKNKNGKSKGTGKSGKNSKSKRPQASKSPVGKGFDVKVISGSNGAMQSMGKVKNLAEAQKKFATKAGDKVFMNLVSCNSKTQFLVCDSANMANVPGIGNLPKSCTQTYYHSDGILSSTKLAKGWYKHKTLNNCITNGKEIIRY